MADKAEAAEDTKKSKSGGLMGLIILAAGCATSAFATVYILTPSAPAGSALACTPGANHDTAPVELPAIRQDYIYEEIPEIVVSIGSGSSTRYLKMQLSIITNKENASSVHKSEVLLQDAFTNYLRSVELSDFEDPAFFPHLREQLGRRSELVLGHTASDGVLITEFLLR